jgi:hypothetical protein
MTGLPRRASALVGIAVVVAVAALAGAGCSLFGSDLPKADDASSEVELTYPGSEEVDRSELDAQEGRNVDGGDMSSDAQVRRTLEADGEVPPDLLRWYVERLKAKGWSVHYRDEQQVGLEQEIDGRYHTYLVMIPTPEGDIPPGTYWVTYSISPG